MKLAYRARVVQPDRGAQRLDDRDEVRVVPEQNSCVDAGETDRHATASTCGATVGALLGNAVRVRRFFIRRLPDSRQDADDLTQEVCARFLAVRDWRSVDDANRYLFGIARHVLADFLTQRRKRQEVSLDAMEGIEDFGDSDWGYDPAVTVGNADLLSILLRRLPVSQRAVLIAHEGVGYSYREVASRLGFTEQTVEMYLKCAKAHLRSLSIAR